ncbi:MAG: hypothetical protein KHZ72_14460 [Lachnospiraceae bacterium]|nr:hypothetical protein [Lachnospiraceae bacterium]
MNESLEAKEIEVLERIADALEAIGSVNAEKREYLNRTVDTLGMLEQSLDCISNRLLDISLGMDQ